MTIVLAVGLVSAPGLALAAGRSQAPSSATSAEAAGVGDQAVPAGPVTDPAPPNPGAPRWATPPAQPFSDAAEDDPNQNGDGEAGGDDDEAYEREDGGPSTSLRALSCLEGEGGNDQDGARRGVQKRDFLKRRRLEISALGGYYASDTLSSTYVYGGAISFFLSEDFGVELLVTRNPVNFRLEQAFTSFDRERHFQSGMAWNVLGAMLWSPIHAKLRWSERHITHADLLLVAGAGETMHQTVQGLTFQAGAGLKLYLNRYLSLRFDVRDLMVPQEVLGQGQTTHNILTTFGLCAWVPG